MKEIIRRLVEALEQYAPRDRAVTQDLIAEARKLLADDGWIRVEDALPVVPRGKKTVRIWLADYKTVSPWDYYPYSLEVEGCYPFWRYAEPMPAPPQKPKE